LNYVLACLTLLQDENALVVLKARGRSIARAVDVAQILTKRFATDVTVKAVRIDTEEVQNDEGSMSNVSCIEIRLQR